MAGAFHYLPDRRAVAFFGLSSGCLQATARLCLRHCQLGGTMTAASHVAGSAARLPKRSTHKSIGGTGLSHQQPPQRVTTPLAWRTIRSASRRLTHGLVTFFQRRCGSVQR